MKWSLRVCTGRKLLLMLMLQKERVYSLLSVAMMASGTPPSVSHQHSPADANHLWPPQKVTGTRSARCHFRSPFQKIRERNTFHLPQVDFSYWRRTFPEEHTMEGGKLPGKTRSWEWNKQTTLLGSTCGSPYLMGNCNCGVWAIQKCIPWSVMGHNIWADFGVTCNMLNITSQPREPFLKMRTTKENKYH